MKATRYKTYLRSVIVILVLYVAMITLIFSCYLFFTSDYAFASQLYDESKKEYDSMTNIADYSQDIKVSYDKLDIERSDAGSKELDKIKALIEEWNRSIDSVKVDEFYKIDPATKKEIEKIYDNDVKVVELLKKKVSLDQLAALAVYRNPALNAAKTRWRSKIERLSQVYNLELIMQDYIAFTNSLATKVGPQKGKKMIDMRFPFPGMLTLKGEIIEKDIEIAKLEYERERIKTITELTKTYHHLLFVLKEEEITKKTFDLLADLEKVANIKYQTGRTSFNDVIKVQIKLENFKDSLKTINEKSINFKAKLAQLLDLPVTTRFGTPREGDFSFNRELDELITIGDANNRDVSIIREKIKRMALMIEMAEKKFYPDFTAGYSYYSDNKVATVGTQSMMEPFMTKPMASHEKSAGYAANDAYIREVKEKYNAMIETLRAKRSAVSYNIKDRHYHIDKAKREEVLYKTNLIPKSKEALEVAKIGYETGTVSFLDALDADMMWLKFNIEYYKSIRHIGISIAEMESFLGRTL